MPVVVCLRNPNTSGITFASYTYGSSIDDVDIPPETLTGDVTYIFAHADSADFGDPVPAPPAGWTTISESSSFRVYRKIWTGAVSFLQVDLGSAGDGTFLTVSFRGVHQTTPEDVTTTVATGGSGMPNCPSITTVTPDAWIIAVGAVADDLSITGYPSGYENTIGLARFDENRALLFATKIKSTAGAEDPGAFTDFAADGSWRALTIALRPA